MNPSNVPSSVRVLVIAVNPVGGSITVTISVMGMNAFRIVVIVAV